MEESLTYNQKIEILRLATINSVDNNDTIKKYKELIKVIKEY